MKNSTLYPFLSLWSCIRRPLSFPCRRFTSSAPTGAAPLSRRCAARPVVVTEHRRHYSSSTVSIFEAPLRGEQNPPASSPFSCTQHRPRELADEADPPPSGAGRCGHPSFPPDPLGMLACFPATRSTHPCSFWPPGTPSRARAGEAPPRAAVPSLSRRARRRASHAHVQGRAIARGRS
jgi:hypothetical protein